MSKPVSENRCSTRTILIADNDKNGRALLKAVLQAAGHRTLAVGDGLEALSCCEQSEVAIDLLLTDLVMPGIDGAELARRLRQLYPRIKLIFMSGLPATLAAQFGYPPGAPFLEKPIPLAELRRKVEEILASN